jgi:hypothetical protein
MQTDRYITYTNKSYLRTRWCPPRGRRSSRTLQRYMLHFVWYAYEYVCMHICMCVYIYIHIYMYTHAYILSLKLQRCKTHVCTYLSMVACTYSHHEQGIWSTMKVIWSHMVTSHMVTTMKAIWSHMVTSHMVTTIQSWCVQSCAYAQLYLWMYTYICICIRKCTPISLNVYVYTYMYT